jgi:hypothetical protein
MTSAAYYRAITPDSPPRNVAKTAAGVVPSAIVVATVNDNNG